MAELKKRILTFSTGKQIKLYGNSLSIGTSLEVGEGYSPNIFSCNNGLPADAATVTVANPHKLTPDELMEMADLIMDLCLQLKKNIRRLGPNDPKIFRKDISTG